MMSGIPMRPSLPKCVTCGKRADRFRMRENATEDQRNGSLPGGADWYCAACEYRMDFPDAHPITTHPEALKPLPLQSERLFEI